MKKEIFANLGLRANSASNIEVVTDSIDSRYRLVESNRSISTETGYLELFRVEAHNAELPTLSARWDQKANSVDIDLLGDVAASRSFKDESGGYTGHHTQIVSDSPRIYRLEIRTPTGPIFFGTVTLNIELGVLIKDNFTCEDSAEATVRPVGNAQNVLALNSALIAPECTLSPAARIP